MGGLTRSLRLRIVAPVVGSLAGLAMIVVGCTSVTEGSAKFNAADAPVYKASVSASAEESAASSSSKESERQKTLSTEAVHTSCEALSSSSVDSITAVNDYVKTFNENGADAQAKAGPAIDSLNHRPRRPEHQRSAVARAPRRAERLGRRCSGRRKRHRGQLRARRFQRRGGQIERCEDDGP